MVNQGEQRVHIAVITPYLDGDYMGEVVNHLQKSCDLKNYRFTAIRTDNFGDFNIAIGLESFSAVIVLRNAANPKLVEKIQNRGIPIVAIAHDYFPLDVPVITSDNSMGAELAFDYLQQRGHKNMCFVGDISQYDLRKRYERFKDLQKLHNYPYTENQLICAPDTLFSGGLAAGAEFITRKMQCTAVFCGAGNTAIGFIKQIEASGVKVPGDLDVIAFDYISMMKALTPELTCIDQNLDLIAHRCIMAVESMIHGGTLPTKAITIAPTLCAINKVKAFANSESSTIRNNNHSIDKLYQQSLQNNSFEMLKNIVDSRLNDIMSIAPLFSDYMDFGILSSVIYDKKQRPFMYTSKIFEPTETTCITGNGEQIDHRFAPEDFPPPAIQKRLKSSFDTWVHFPIYSEQKLCGVLSLAGAHKHEQHCGSFTSFTSFIDNVCFSYAKVTEIANLQQQLKHSQDDSAHIHQASTIHTNMPTFDWNLETGTVSWSDLALELVGFTTELEKNIYRNMEIFDRIHPDDEQKLRKEITSSLSTLQDMTTVARIKNAEGDYHPYSFQGEILDKHESHPVSYRCCLSLVN